MRSYADRHEICDWVILEVGRQDRRGNMGAHGSCQERIAVWWSRSGALTANRATSTADVLDDHRLPEELGHLIGHNACNHVAGTAGRERHRRQGTARSP